LKKTNHKINSISSVILEDPELTWCDPEAKTAGYFCRKMPVRIDFALLEELKGYGQKQDVRLCLHECPSSDFHEMIILQHKEGYYRPHKHPDKGESYHIIEGVIAICLFDEKGEILDICKLDYPDNILYRIGPNMYHATFPLTDVVVYHESKLGPFIRETDAVFPEWSPKENDKIQIEFFKKKIFNAVIENEKKRL